MSALDRLGDGVMGAIERGWLPDAVVRWGIRRLCAQRLRDEARRYEGDPATRIAAAFGDALRDSVVAAVPEKANAQHYAVPPELFQLMLGPRLKYSCCWWGGDVVSLDQAEEAALAQTAERAQLADGLDILELGCGWGSLSLWMAERFPNSRIVAVSNSASQRSFIEQRARARGLPNLTVVTADMNVFDTDRRFDRILSVEMFEHMRNYHVLFERIGRWLRPDGQLFVHVFCHRTWPYFFEEAGAGNWMGRHFFSGGLMPSRDLLPTVSGPLALEAQWDWDGRHYARTARAWLERIDRHHDETLAVLARAYGAREARQWLGRWRIFLMACEELFGYGGGREWGVAHYRFAPSAATLERAS